MAIVIAGERSGAGKTTITLGLLAYLKRKGLPVQSFKVGPDYIDPMFHHYVTGRPCRNLDPVLTTEEYVSECFDLHTQDVEFALVEGVMGLFDGIRIQNSTIASYQEKKELRENSGQETGTVDFSSTAHIARLLDVPVIFVIDCSRLSGSVAAIAHGYRTFDPRIYIAGVILNRVGSDRHRELLEDALQPLNLPIVGILQRHDRITIPDRHLGLVPTAELSQLDPLIDQLAHLAETCFDWERLLPMLRTRERGGVIQRLELMDPQSSPIAHHAPIKIAIARDPAFNFYYQDNLDILESLGAELVFWSPLTDPKLPEGVRGLYFGGGFPEMFAEQLTNNTSVLKAVRMAIQAGIPTYAECGGLMYLCENLVDLAGQSWPMVGILPTTAVMGKRLTLGYRRATALQESPLLSAGEIVVGHEFHRSHLSSEPTSPLFEIRGFGRFGTPAKEGWGFSFPNPTPPRPVHASYIHLHWGARPEIPIQFLEHCLRFANPFPRE